MARTSRNRFLLLALGLVALGGLWGDCTEKTPCSANEEFRSGYCYPLAPGSFGQSCTVGGTECASPAPYCAAQSGDSTGFCTAFGCDTDPNLCPSTWTCMDLSQQYKVALHICLPGTPLDGGALDTAEGEAGAS